MQAGLAPEEFLRRRVEQLLDRPDEQFRQAAAYVLDKNGELGTVLTLRCSILKIMLSELTTVRLLCQAKGCQGITELPVSKLKKGMICPLCQKEFDASGYAALEELASAFRLLDNAKKDVLVEFVLPDSSPATQS